MSCCTVTRTCRGMSGEYEKLFTPKKKLRRFLSTWSFYVDILLTVIAAVGRGWATTQPCGADGKVQLLQLLISLFAFIFTLLVQPNISPMRRYTDILGGFVMVMATFCLAVLGAVAAKMPELRRYNIHQPILSEARIVGEANEQKESASATGGI